MGRLLSFLFSINGCLTSTLVVAVWVFARPQSSAARRGLLAIVIWFGVASVYAVPAIVTRGLAAGFHEFTGADAPAGQTAIVLLGGGGITVSGFEHQRVGVSNDSSAARTLEAARVARLLPDALVISSGGNLPSDRDKAPSGTMMRDLLVSLGVSPARILVENDSRDTHDEAVIVQEMLRARRIEHVVLVTSDVHMRRSLGVFRAQGMHAIPAIAPNPYFDGSWTEWLEPSRAGLDFTNGVVHELVGIPYYWWRGWYRSE
jgi:uncharacterized SAM-binding protein YcdF (DUF218 family)